MSERRVGDGPTDRGREGGREGEEDAPPSLSLSLSLSRCFASFDCLKLCKKITHVVGRLCCGEHSASPARGVFFGELDLGHFITFWSQK